MKYLPTSTFGVLVVVASSWLSSSNAFTATNTKTTFLQSRASSSQQQHQTLFIATDPTSEAAAAPVKEEKQDNTASTEPQSDIINPSGAKNAWEVHKFGGASLATAELYKTVGDLLLQEAEGRGDGSIPTMAVVSAKGGMTDLLVEVVDSALLDMHQAEVALQQAVTSQIAVLRELVPDRPDITDPIIDRFRQDEKDILSVVQSLRMIATVPAVTMEVVTGFGEIWSAQTLHAYLQTLDIPTAWLDARDVLIVKSNSAGLGEKGSSSSTGGVTPLWEETSQRLSLWWNNQESLPREDFSNVAPIVVVTGFVAKTVENVPTTLKRSGSDYSATIFAKLTDAARVTMWKNTNGVYTADPRRVPEAFPIASLKYDEAMELAYFGAQVLHPSAMEPCIDKNIPVYVRNIFNPAFEGTVISGRCPTLEDTYASQQGSVQNWRARKGEIPIKGITSVDKVALVSLEGASIAGADVAHRFLGAMSSNGISVLIITQASSESSITIAVPESQGRAALAALEDTFELELARSTVNSLSLTTDMSIVAIVGEGMALKSGVSSTFMSSLARANVNIRVIAQGSSERQIAIVCKADDTSRALRAAHMAFTLSETTASVAILGGTGKVGRALTKQIQCQNEHLVKDMGAEICVNLASCRTKMACGENSGGLDLTKIPEILKSDEEGQAYDLDQVTTIMQADVNPLRVIVDCTNTEEAGDYYEKWLSQGIHVISPGRKVGAGDLERYNRVCAATRGYSVEWYLESSVGSALPIISTIRDLFQTGDTIKTMQGCLSGTMAFVLSTFDDTISFSEAVKMAADRGYTEANLCDDLNGLDMARKIVILARQIGLDVNIEDVDVEPVVPESFGCGIDEEDILEKIKELDAPMLERLKAAQEKGCRLRYKFVIDASTGKCSCKLVDVANHDPVYRLHKNENLVAFETKRYETSPLIVKGAAAGPELAASGIFADLLRLTRAYSANQI